MSAKILSTLDVAIRLNVSPERVRQLSNEGKLRPSFTSRGQRLFDPADVERLVSERKQKEQRAGYGK